MSDLKLKYFTVAPTITRGKSCFESAMPPTWVVRVPVMPPSSGFVPRWS
jgi:hypothetical protein